MKYENPTIEVIELLYTDVITLSGADAGDEEGITGPWA